MGRSNQEPQNCDPLEEQIFQRISDWQCRFPNGNGPRDPQLEGLIYQFLYRELRGIAAVLPGLGPRAINQRADVSCRYTSVLNKAFLRIIEKYPDKLMQSKSRKQLTGYVSRTMSNLMLNHYKRKGTYQKIMKQLGLTEGEDAEVRDILRHLTEEKGDYFEKRTGMSFAEGLAVVRRWDQSSDPEENARADVLRLRYVDGLGYDDIARELMIDRDAVEKLLEQAKYHLRKLQK